MNVQRCCKDRLKLEGYFQFENEVGLYNVDRKSMASLAILLIADLQGKASRAAS